MSNEDDLLEALSTPPAPRVTDRPGISVAKAGENPGDVTWDGTRGVIWTQPMVSQPDTWDDVLIEAGFDPAVVEVIEPFRFKMWDALGKADKETGVNPKHRMRWYGLNLRTKLPGASVAELEKRISQRRPRTRPAPAGPSTFVLALGDLQLGKFDGDGYEGTYLRARDRIERAAIQLGTLRKVTPIGPVHIAWLGDGCEGFVSQGGSNTWRTNLTITEQMRLLRRLMMYSIDVFLPLTDELSIICVPGNHDQALRPGGKGSMTGSDSFDVEALISIADALKLNPEAYGHVTIHVPERDEMTVTVETSNTIIGHAHGHKWNRGKHFEWWKGQLFGRQSVGQADVLLAGHLHHLLVEDEGLQRFVQVPSLESESTWYRHRTGSRGAPGVVTMIVRDGRTHYLDVL